MIKVKIKTENHFKIIIPVPYAILHASSALLFSAPVWGLMLKNTNRNIEGRNVERKTIDPQLLDRKMIKRQIKQLIKELRSYKGLTLLDARLTDGTEVLVRL